MIRIFINNYNRLTWTSALVDQCKKFSDSEVVIIDNNSNYQPLLDWYNTNPCEVVRLDQNYGPRAPWDSGTTVRMATDFYVISDPDLDLSSVPADALMHLREGLDTHQKVIKAGLSLEIDDLPDNNLKEQILGWERQYWTNKADRFWIAPVDTTFALYERDRASNGDFYSGIRADRPYTARHLPWYVNKENITDEERHYLSSASPAGIYWTPRIAEEIK